MSLLHKFIKFSNLKQDYELKLKNLMNEYELNKSTYARNIFFTESNVSYAKSILNVQESDINNLNNLFTQDEEIDLLKISQSIINIENKIKEFIYKNKIEVLIKKSIYNILSNIFNIICKIRAFSI